MSPTKAKLKGKGGPGRGQGRKKIERPPAVKDAQFAARVLEQVGSKRWTEFLDAVLTWRAWDLPTFCFEDDPDGKKLQKFLDAKPPHPKTLVENDEDLALYHLLFNDDRGMFVILMEKRDGKAMHTVNHLHDKPIEHNVTLELGERMRLAMEKAEQRVNRRGH